MSKQMRFESDLHQLITPRDNYLILLQRIHEKGLFGRLSIYPAIGVDGLIALYAEKIIGLNLMQYDPEDILKYISPILSQDLILKLDSKLRNNVVFSPRIDVSRLDLVQKGLQRCKYISPKSLILKGMFENVFLLEWDSDTERFYNVSPKTAGERARKWIKEMAGWLSADDVIVAFDRHLFPFLSELYNLEEIDIGINDLGEDFDSVYLKNVPIIYLPHFAMIFKVINL